MRREGEDGLKATWGRSHIRDLKNSGCRHRNKSAGRRELAGEAEETSSGPVAFEVMGDVAREGNQCMLPQNGAF